MYAELTTTDPQLIVRQLDLLDLSEGMQITVRKRGNEYCLVAFDGSEPASEEVETTS
jgi:hypothetical protein